MQNLDPFLRLHTQNYKLPIRLISPRFGQLPAEITGSFGTAHRKFHYFILLMLDGHGQHGVDLQQLELAKDELLFILPHQIHRVPHSNHGNHFFKLGFDDESLSRLPQQYPFLVNPFNHQKIKLTPAVAARLKSIFQIMEELLSDMNTEPELILAHLNSLLTEINAAYFSVDKSPADDKLSKYILFKIFIEEHLTSHLSIKDIAMKLGLNVNSLYNMVRHYSGLSPKEYITS